MRSDALVPLIQWGAYGSYSGPWTLGRVPFRIGDPEVFLRRALATTSATEGGHVSAVNCYDKCDLTVGAVQVCEAEDYAVAALLGKCAERDHDLLFGWIEEMVRGTGARIGMDHTTRGWRFVLDGVPITNTKLRSIAFFGGSPRPGDSWTPAQRAHARCVCAVLAAMWEEPEFQEVQDDFNSKRLLNYVMPATKKILFGEGFPAEGAEGAMRAGLVSFSVNNPARADRHFRMVEETQEYRGAGAEKRMVLVLRELTFGPKVAIYPARYNAIRPVLERLFRVDLPDFAQELQQHQEASPWAEHFASAAKIQEALILLGYDLGPKGADGVWGGKSTAALLKFETSRGLRNPDGVPDEQSMDELWRALQQREAGVLADYVAASASSWYERLWQRVSGGSK